MLLIRCRLVCLLCLTVLATTADISLASDDQSAEEAVRALIRANAEKDIGTLSKMMAHDADITSYTIGGRKYVGWPDFERDMQEEFQSAHTIEIPIRELKVWSKGDVAW